MQRKVTIKLDADEIVSAIKAWLEEEHGESGPFDIRLDHVNIHSASVNYFATATHEES